MTARPLSLTAEVLDRFKGIRGEPDDPVEDDAGQFYLCEDCGQAIDRRELYQVLWHEQEEHERLPGNG